VAEDRSEPRPEKVAAVDEIEARLNAAVSALFVEMHGITVAEVSDLRNQLRDAGVSFRVYKNTMVNLAAQRIGLEGMEQYLTGPTAIAVSPDEPSTAAKVFRAFGKTNDKVRIKAGLLGTQVLNESEAAALADLPTYDESIAQLAGVLQAPITALAGTLNAMISGLALALSRVAEQQGEAAAE
jgi:large subunit ribosomal protein L10